jgi:hypothetical protein
MLRSTHERSMAAAAANERALRSRLFVLRDNAKQAVWRVRMNLSRPDNAAAERILTMALVRDLEKDPGNK